METKLSNFWSVKNGRKTKAEYVYILGFIRFTARNLLKLNEFSRHPQEHF